MEKQERIDYLVKSILYHKKLYYSGNTLIPDYAYDRLETELESLDPSNPVLELVGPGSLEFEK